MTANPNRKYWAALDDKGTHIGGNVLPTFRETFDAQLRELAGEDHGLQVVETTKAEVDRRVSAEARWVLQVVDLQERAYKKPIRPETLKSTAPVDGIKVNGWGIHLVVAIEDGEYFYSLFAVRFDHKFNPEVTSQLNSVLMLLGAIPPPIPQIDVVNSTYHFYWKADLDPPQADT